MSSLYVLQHTVSRPGTASPTRGGDAPGETAALPGSDQRSGPSVEPGEQVRGRVRARHERLHLPHDLRVLRGDVLLFGRIPPEIVELQRLFRRLECVESHGLPLPAPDRLFAPLLAELPVQ